MIKRYDFAKMHVTDVRIILLYLTQINRDTTQVPD